MIQIKSSGTQYKITEIPSSKKSDVQKIIWEHGGEINEETNNFKTEKSTFLALIPNDNCESFIATMANIILAIA